MPNKIILKKKIPNFSKNISIPGDKSISIRWVLISSFANGVSTAKNLLLSEDVLASIQAVKKLGVKVVVNKNTCKIYGVGVGGYKYKKNLIINAQNSGTLGRLIAGILIDTPYTTNNLVKNFISASYSITYTDFQNQPLPYRLVV